MKSIKELVMSSSTHSTAINDGGHTIIKTNGNVEPVIPTTMQLTAIVNFIKQGNILGVAIENKYREVRNNAKQTNRTDTRRYENRYKTIRGDTEPIRGDTEPIRGDTKRTGSLCLCLRWRYEGVQRYGCRGGWYLWNRPWGICGTGSGVFVEQALGYLWNRL